MKARRILIIILIALTALMFGGCCYQQPYGPSFHDDVKAEKDKSWFFGVGSAMKKPFVTAPLLFNDRLYITGMDGMVYCIDKDKGQVVDGFEFNGGRPLKAGFRSKPVTDGVLIYVTSYDHNLYAIDPITGIKQWAFATDSQIEGAAAMISGKIFVANWTGKVYCIDKESLQEMWVFKADAPVRCTPMAYGGKLYFGDKAGKFYCITTGSIPELVWEFQAGDEIYGEPVTDGELVWFTSLDHNIYCRDASTGEEKWTFETGSEVWAGPYIDKFLLGSNELSTVGIGELSVAEGEEIVVTEEEVTVIEAGDTGETSFVAMRQGEIDFLEVPVARLYIGSMDANFYILDAYTGERARYIDAESGEEREIAPIECGDAVEYDHGVRGTAVTDDKYAYFCGGDFFFRAVDKRTGQVKWMFDVLGEVWGQPLAYEEKVVFACEDTYFYGLHTGSGSVVKGIKQ